MPAHTCNLLHGTCARAHSAFGTCYFKLPIRQQAALVRAGSVGAVWSPVDPRNTELSNKLAANIQACWLYYAKQETVEAPVVVASVATARSWSL